LKYIDYEFDDLNRAERLLDELKDAILNFPQVQQVLHKRQYNRQLADHELYVALDGLVYAGFDDQLEDLREEEKRRTQWSAHLM